MSGTLCSQENPLQFVAKYSMREALNLNDLFLRKDYLRRIILPVIDWQIYFWIRGPITLTPQRVTRYGQGCLC